jgi:hypothetical protein
VETHTKRLPEVEQFRDLVEFINRSYGMPEYDAVVDVLVHDLPEQGWRTCLLGPAITIPYILLIPWLISVSLWWAYFV